MRKNWDGLNWQGLSESIIELKNGRIFTDGHMHSKVISQQTVVKNWLSYCEHSEGDKKAKANFIKAYKNYLLQNDLNKLLADSQKE